ncbi:hypothetical protein K2X30_06245 [bacterium]|jgi:hypothetical protein|nr:hypothetical protein [bacterium]
MNIRLWAFVILTTVFSATPGWTWPGDLELSDYFAPEKEAGRSASFALSRAREEAQGENDGYWLVFYTDDFRNRLPDSKQTPEYFGTARLRKRFLSYRKSGTPVERLRA